MIKTLCNIIKSKIFKVVGLKCYYKTALKRGLQTVYVLQLNIKNSKSKS